MQPVFILGSCVTRDAFEFVQNDYQLEGYVCRTSFGSAFLHEAFGLSVDQIDPDLKMSSKFHRRMVDTDIRKQLRDMLMNLDPSTLLLVDLIDERHHLIRHGQTLATYSVGMQEVETLKNFPDLQVVTSGSDEHLELWKKGLAEFADLVSARKPAVVLNAVSYAAEDNNGAAFYPPYVARENAHLQRLYDMFVKSIPCFVIDYDIPIKADAAHKWGRSPFHYDLPVYEHFMHKLNGYVEARSRGA